MPDYREVKVPRLSPHSVPDYREVKVPRLSPPFMVGLDATGLRRASALTREVVFFQEPFHFLSERPLSVMCFLILDVYSHVAKRRFAYRNGLVLIRPLELCCGHFLLIGPVGALSLHELQRLCNRDICVETEQTVKMISRAVETLDIDFLLPRVVPDVIYHLIPNLLRQHWLVAFRPPYGMNPHSDVRH